MIRGSPSWLDNEALGWHLEEIHVTWVHLEKKQTRLRLYTKSFEETVHTERGYGVAITKRRRQVFFIDGITDLAMASEHSDNDSDDGEVLNELEEYGNARKLCRQWVINSFDGDDLAFQCMIGFRKFVAYFDPFLPINIITRKAHNTIMVEGLESTGKNLVSIVRDVYVFVGSFTYITDFVILEDIGELS
ncbi:hypothetical protein Tco_1492905 [Tanacetum coccineum]